MYWLTSKEVDSATQVQIMNEVACISQSTNNLEKGMNSTILSSAMNR